MLRVEQDASNAGCARSAGAFSKLLVVGRSSSPPGRIPAEDRRSPSPAREPSSLDCEFGGHHPTPQSKFQHLLEVFDQGAMHSISEKLETLFVII